MTAYSLHPGVIDTNLAADIPVAELFKMFFKKKTVAKGVATTIYCTLKPGLENESGCYFDNSAVNDLADKWADKDINTYWQWTEKVIEERTPQLNREEPLRPHLHLYVDWLSTLSCSYG